MLQYIVTLKKLLKQSKFMKL